MTHKLIEYAKWGLEVYLQKTEQICIQRQLVLVINYGLCQRLHRIQVFGINNHIEWETT